MARPAPLRRGRSLPSSFPMWPDQRNRTIHMDPWEGCRDAPPRLFNRLLRPLQASKANASRFRIIEAPATTHRNRHSHSPAYRGAGLSPTQKESRVGIPPPFLSVFFLVVFTSQLHHLNCPPCLPSCTRAIFGVRKPRLRFCPRKPCLRIRRVLRPGPSRQWRDVGRKDHPAFRGTQRCFRHPGSALLLVAPAPAAARRSFFQLNAQSRSLIGLLKISWADAN